MSDIWCRPALQQLREHLSGRALSNYGVNAGVSFMMRKALKQGLRAFTCWSQAKQGVLAFGPGIVWRSGTATNFAAQTHSLFGRTRLNFEIKN
jgi:hypothetical protein